MWNGDVYSYDKSHKNYVWPVCAGQSGSPDSLYPANSWKTGQTTSYQSGDDGDLQRGVSWPTPRFTDHGNGSVTDNLTGLMWSQDANAPGSTDCNPSITKTWQQALDYIGCLNSNAFLGYTDWRLPNRKELHSITDFSRYNPALPSEHPYTNVQPYNYWVSTTNANDTVRAWYLSMWVGGVYTSKKSFDWSVWPVRAGQVESNGCSTWADVITKYNAYVSDQAVWNDVITCYSQYLAVHP